ncbi:hypothetical protein PQX77_001471 [Marasmius sp. AFHP31]|nr:hypothetical protein PQX77_001471 [Marasmius sp. AFHP31]
MSNQSYSPFHRFSVHAPAHPVGGQWQRAEDLVGSGSSSPDTSLNNVSDVLPNQQPGQNANSSSPSLTGTRHVPQAAMTSKSPTEQLMHLAELQMMANRLGIPSMLPKPPSSSTNPTMSPPSSSSSPAAVVTQLAQSSSPASSPAPTSDFQSQLQAYLLMLSQQPSTASTSSTLISSSPANADVDNGGIAVENGIASSQAAIQNTAANDVASPYSPYLTSPENAVLGDEFLASPIFTDASPVFSEFLDDFTSPLLSNQTSPVSPIFDEFNTSPGMDSPLADFLNTPIMDAVDQVGVEGSDAQWAPLFNDAALGVYEPLEQQKAVEAPVASTSGTVSPPTTTISPSDMSPTVSPLNMTMSPSASTTAPAAMQTRSSSHGQSRTPNRPQPQRRFVPNGTRKGVTPDTLIPVDAPIQSRHRTASSSSSSSKRRKTESGAVPTGADPEDDEEDNDERKRAAKRERNTLAARTSRKRKLEHQLQLQDANDKLAVEIQQWKTRAEVMEGMLKANGWPGSMWDIKV